jgi:hypothetical protein
METHESRIRRLEAIFTPGVTNEGIDKAWSTMLAFMFARSDGSLPEPSREELNVAGDLLNKANESDFERWRNWKTANNLWPKQPFGTGPSWGG